MDDALRKRLDTGCTIASQDSGIEVRRMRPPRKSLKIIETPMNTAEPEGNWDIASILWILVFGLTVWIFHLPMSIWFSKKVSWTQIYVSLFFYASSLSCGLFMYIKHRRLTKWNKLSPLLYQTSVLLFLAGSICFCTATFALFGWWSVGICLFTLMFLLSLSEILA